MSRVPPPGQISEPFSPPQVYLKSRLNCLLLSTQQDWEVRAFRGFAFGISLLRKFIFLSPPPTTPPSGSPGGAGRGEGGRGGRRALGLDGDRPHVRARAGPGQTGQETEKLRAVTPPPPKLNPKLNCAPPLSLGLPPQPLPGCGFAAVQQIKTPPPLPSHCFWGDLWRFGGH